MERPEVGWRLMNRLARLTEQNGVFVEQLLQQRVGYRLRCGPDNILSLKLGWAGSRCRSWKQPRCRCGGAGAASKGVGVNVTSEGVGGNVTFEGVGVNVTSEGVGVNVTSPTLCLSLELGEQFGTLCHELRSERRSYSQLGQSLCNENVLTILNIFSINMLNILTTFKDHQNYSQNTGYGSSDLNQNDFSCH